MKCSVLECEEEREDLIAQNSNLKGKIDQCPKLCAFKRVWFM